MASWEVIKNEKGEEFIRIFPGTLGSIREIRDSLERVIQIQKALCYFLEKENPKKFDLAALIDTVSKLEETRILMQKEIKDREMLEAQKIQESKRKANREVAKKYIIPVVDNITYTYDDHIKREYVRHDGFIDDELDVKVEEIFSTFLDGLQALPDSRTHLEQFKAELYKDYVGETFYPISLLGKKEKHIFTFHIGMEWKT